MVCMTIKELKEKIQNLPDDAKVDINLGIKINGSKNDLPRQIDFVDYHEKNNVVVLSSSWPIQLFY